MKVGEIFTEESFGTIIQYEVTKVNDNGTFESKMIGFGPIENKIAEVAEEVAEEVVEKKEEVKKTAPVKTAPKKAPAKKPVAKKK